MQFSMIAAALMATVVSAGSTLYVTDVVTITSCAPTVTDCPAASTVTSTTSYITTTSVPAVYHNTTLVPTYPSETSVYEPVVPTTKPELSVITISTCVPTVIYSTVTVQPTTTKVPEYTPKPTGVVAPTGGASGTVAPYPTFTGAASHLSGSLYVAGLGLAAFLFA